jgi:hypothetical protein
VVNSGEVGLKHSLEKGPMELYPQRAFRFFLQSIQTLKKESGGQRWNAICEDAATLFEQTFPKDLGPLYLSRDEVWELLFDPPESVQNPLYMKFEILCSKEKFLDFFFIILQCLLDPPASWWNSHV